jgi:bifunctional DNA-binding transcriptional regulator/antitoxin component of YhaV-PrlF toxin-antitoxin module
MGFTLATKMHKGGRQIRQDSRLSEIGRLYIGQRLREDLGLEPGKRVDVLLGDEHNRRQFALRESRDDIGYKIGRQTHTRSHQLITQCAHLRDAFPDGGNCTHVMRGKTAVVTVHPVKTGRGAR